MMTFMVLVPLILILFLVVLLVLFFRRPVAAQPEDLSSWAESGAGGGDQSERRTYLIVPDITGYTRFLSLNRFSVGHAQHIISELLGVLIRRGRPRLALSKVEGDAILFYADAEPSGDLHGGDLGGMLVELLAAFYAKRAELQKSNLCPCKACRHIADLDLKIIVHCGPVLRYRLGELHELSGLPVIAVHRLLKSKLALDRYLMVTDRAGGHCKLPGGFTPRSHIESYDGIGEVASQVYAFDPADLPQATPAAVAAPLASRSRDLARKLSANLRTLRQSIGL